MAILIDENTRVLVQGATGGQGAFHTERMIEYGTNVVAGVTPGKGGKQILKKIPVFDTVLQAVRETGANTSCIFVPPKFATDAIMEAIDAQMKLVVTITEHIPALDMIKVHRVLDAQTKTRLVGPNCPGIISPGKCKVGIMPGYIHKPGHVGVVSRSGTLTYEAVSQLSALGIGQSTCVGIGGDSIIGTDFTDVLRMFNEDDETHQVVLIGEIGGTAEELAAEYIKTNFKKPVVALIAGKTAPPGKRMGHAGALISGGRGAAAAKIKALKAVGVNVVDAPSAIGTTLQSVL